MESKDIQIQVYPTKDEWKEARKTHFTSSRVNELAAIGKRKMTKEEQIEWKKMNPKSKVTTIEDHTILGDGAISYILELIQNQIAEPKPDFYNAKMEWGNEQEPQAAIYVADYFGMDINDDDFIYTSSNGVVYFNYLGYTGGTPDILLKRYNSIAEIKCPDSDTHLHTMLFYTAENFQENEPKYYDQMQYNMMLTNTEVCFFASFDPRQKYEYLKLFIIKITANKERQQFLFERVKLANNYKKELLNKLTSNKIQ